MEITRVADQGERHGKSPLDWHPLSETASELTKRRLEVYREMIEAMNVPPWVLTEVGQSSAHGASAYGYFSYRGDGPVAVKIRISDHGGRWSGFDLDVRHQSRTRMEKILRGYLSRRGEQIRTKAMRRGVHG